MSLQVIIFFLMVTLGILASGLLISKKFKSDSVKTFSYSLTLIGLAFGIWTVAVALKPDDFLLSLLISLGLGVFSLAQLLNIYLATKNKSKSVTYSSFAIGTLLLFAILVLRIIFPSTPTFSENGMIFFNPHDVVNFLEILFISGAIIPAAIALYNEIKKENEFSANLIVAAVFASLLGGLILITSTKVTLLTLDGWAMGFATLALVTGSSGILGRKAKKK